MIRKFSSKESTEKRIPNSARAGASRPDAVRRHDAPDFVNRRPLSIAQRGLQQSIDESPRQTRQGKQLASAFGMPAQRQGGTYDEQDILRNVVEPAQRQAGAHCPVSNRGGLAGAGHGTGMPDEVGAGLERLSGMNLSGVREHDASLNPVQLNARAFAQGRGIDLRRARAQDHPHVSRHVVQPMHGRVKTSVQAEGVSINGAPALEHEADVMGAMALGATITEAPGAHSDDHTAPAENRAQPPASSNCFTVQRKFDASTTFGLEIEFKNRMVSPYDYGKDLTEYDIADAPLTGWKAGTDRGRPSLEEGPNSTVLEYESSVYSGTDWKNGDVNTAVSAALQESLTYGQKVRETNNLDDAGSEEQKRLLDPNHPEHAGTKANSDRGAIENTQPPSATIQITTLGKRTEAHLATLGEVSEEINKKNVALAAGTGLQDLFDAFNEAKIEAATIKADLRSNANPRVLRTKEGRLVMEDLEAVSSVLMQSLYLSYQGIGQKIGTAKNLIEPLPRRIIGPPQEGFKNRLGIKDSVYLQKLAYFRMYLKAIEPEDLTPLQDTIRYTLAWFAHGASKKNKPIGETKTGVSWKLADVLLELSKKKKKDKVSLLHDIAESEPTLESEIIARANKSNPSEWTSHEIRNILFAGGLDEALMLEFVDLMKGQM